MDTQRVNPIVAQEMVPTEEHAIREDIESKKSGDAKEAQHVHIREKSVDHHPEEPTMQETFEVDPDHLRAGLPFPEDPNAVPEEWQLTVRAIVVGCLLGAIVAASNIYLGLKTGFTFGPQLFGAILGFAIL